ncbi:MAG: shikimate dehydrogenase [bacterium]
MEHAYRFGLFGHPVRHSLSPVMHAASFLALGLRAEYVCFDVPPDELAARLAECRLEGFDGLNLTIPHKQAAVPLMGVLDASARLYGAVNTVRFDAQGSTGFNTDATGFLTDLKESRGVTPEGRRVLILGCGGAGRALAIACAIESAGKIGLADLIVPKAKMLAEEIGERFPDAVAQVDVLSDEPDVWARYSRDCDLVVHCTPAGLHAGDRPPLSSDAFHKGQLLYDLVYTARVTPTMRSALEAGADVLNGAGMLVHQGAAAFSIWTGLAADTAAMRAALEARIYGI